MKIHDIISEGKTTDRRPSHDAVSKGATRARDVGGYDRVYHMNRVGMAMAMADGQSTKAVDSPQDTWFEKYNTYHPYTQEEANKVKAAINTIPSDTKEVSKFGKSEEPDFVNKTSPVAKPKKNKYGV
jgi:hypothetical protein